MAKKKKNLILAGELADLLGVSKQRVAKLLSASAGNDRLRKVSKKIGRRWFIDEKKALEILSQDRDPQQDELDFGLDAGKEVTTFQKARALEKQYQAANKQLDYEERRGRLISVDLVRREAYLAGTMIKESLNAAVSRIAPLVTAQSKVFENEQILKKEFDEILQKYSDMTKEAGFA